MTLPEQDLAHVLEHTRCWDLLRHKRLFLTGASGFVGTWLSESFNYANTRLALGAQLTSISRTALPPGDFDLGIHAAKADAFLDDLNGTRRILDFAAHRGVSRLLFTSSGAVYGTLPPGTTNVSEDFPCAPETTYAKAKFAGEQLCAQYCVCTVIARLFAFVGPALPLDRNFAVGNFIRDVIAGLPIAIQGDGTSRRSYLYAADLAIWLWTLLLLGESARPYNVGSPDSISIADLAQVIAKNTRPEALINILGAEGATTYVPSVQRAQTELNLKPIVPLAEGIRRMYAWNLAAKNREMTVASTTTP